MDFYSQILRENIDGIIRFIELLVHHQGTINIERLNVVDFTTTFPIVRKGQLKDKKSDYAIVTGGEIVNSFTPLYELGYFFISLFLAGIGTAVIHKDLIEKYKKVEKSNFRENIKSDLLNLSENEILEGMKKPVIAIISSLDSDVVPIRYFKHQLWRLDPSVLTKRVAEITKDDYGKSPPSPVDLHYWTQKDQEIANLAIERTSSLKSAKVIQYSLVLQIFLEKLDIDIKKIPLYFNFVPKDEVVENGVTNSLLKVIIGLHTPENRRKYRKITNNPKKSWIITKACPQCGQGDKRILSSRQMADGTTIVVRCKPNEYSFHNEHGDKIFIRGCGYQFSFTVPETPEDLYSFFKNEDFSIHFATRELLAVLKDSAVTPVAFVAEDLGVIRNSQGALIKDKDQVKGYGDNLEMLISALGLQHFFIKGKIAGSVSLLLKQKGLLMPQATTLFAYDCRTELIDTDITTLNSTGNSIPVSDTSALKALNKGISVKELFKKAVKTHAFSIEELYGLRSTSVQSIEKVLG